MVKLVIRHVDVPTYGELGTTATYSLDFVDVPQARKLAKKLEGLLEALGKIANGEVGDGPEHDAYYGVIAFAVGVLKEYEADAPRG